MEHQADMTAARGRVRLGIVVALGVLLLLACGAWYTLRATGESARLAAAADMLADFGTVPDVSLVERSGRPMSLGELKGSVWVASFIFTKCAGSCPAMSAQMGEMQESLRKVGDAKLVSFTVDPKNDTPERLAEYARKYNADGGRWLFLTGSSEQMQDLAKNSFHLAMEEGTDPNEPIIHSKRFILVDREGHIRGYYNSDEPEAKGKLLHDIGTLMRGDAR
jgi:protein SCO1/2